jgi:hypothetical protein
MSKVDDILDDELDPEDLDPTPRGGKSGRGTSSTTSTSQPKQPGQFIAAILAGAFVVLAACNGGTATPPGTASCDEPASWCTAGERP